LWIRVIEEKRYSSSVTNYNKYKCIRNILSHKEGQQLHEHTAEDFTKYFRPVRNAFDFMHCDETNKIFIFDLDSPKTKQTLEQLTTDLIREVQDILGFPK
jgi:hypothetical protein